MGGALPALLGHDAATREDRQILENACPMRLVRWRSDGHGAQYPLAVVGQQQMQGAAGHVIGDEQQAGAARLDQAVQQWKEFLRLGQT